MAESNPNALLPTPAVALTGQVDPRKVKRPEDLSPAMAREVAETVATHQPTRRELLRHEALPLFGILTAAGAGLFLLGPHHLPLPALVGGVVGGVAGLYNAWRAAPVRKAMRELKKLGVPWLGRWRIAKKLQKIAGTFPARDPADRPPAEVIAQRLEPVLADDGLQAPIQKPVRIDDARALSDPQARAFVDQWLTWRMRGRVLLGIFTGMPLVFSTFLLARGAPIYAAGIVIGIQLPIFLGAWVGFRAVIRGKLRQHLGDLGLPKPEQKKILKAIKRAAKSKAWRKLKGSAQRQGLGDGLRRELGAALSVPNKNPALGGAFEESEVESSD
jgi:hypothetical protein